MKALKSAALVAVAVLGLAASTQAQDKMSKMKKDTSKMSKMDHKKPMGKMDHKMDKKMDGKMSKMKKDTTKKM